jgi:hypothetical protein
MDADRLVADACAAAGRDDFGDDAWREGLARLVTALDREAGLSGSLSSVRPPIGDEMDTDPRVEAARADAAGMEALNPGFKAIHCEAPDGPTECVAVLAQDFKSLLWSVIAVEEAGVPG